MHNPENPKTGLQPVFPLQLSRQPSKWRFDFPNRANAEKQRDGYQGAIGIIT